ncbi:hypothetical protein DACRYDRAFT_80307 [Dacryopinax primogenitus]|uniref:PhoD-like phosphatase metallophosphatase domain-containing protein n=1 Tax=Dacryopinax primogenitus (strain DJM 731) TaxID=1858805 RepID=M5FWT4_DACPD|nr:uncharacterized protein DACRYDRAFT_80307 [Dacryopinax primogenitus]EJU00869.1 hypothetical protein DACRYDRAFT_80307 [Dacryopinax primogenitus]
MDPLGPFPQEPTPNTGDEGYVKFGGADWSNADYIYSGSVNFTHSVASGDPDGESFLIWTRAFPAQVAAVDVPVCVSYAVYTTPHASGPPVLKGTAYTSYDVDFTVKVEAKALYALSLYYYQFANCAKPEEKSPIGRGRTAPDANTPAEKVGTQRFAVYSCSNLPFGFFNAFGNPTVKESVDYYIHLGDYIYEYKNGDYGNGTSIGRVPLPDKEIATLSDYRTRIAQYRTDPDLQEAHRQFSWYIVWDDHDVADQAWKAGTADTNDTAFGCSILGVCFTERKASAIRAFHEWQPIRQIAADDKLRIWHNIQFGKLFDLTLLDTRQYERDITDLYYNTDYVGTLSSTEDSRSLMGKDQEDWLYSTLDTSVQRGATWRIVGQQIVFGALNYTGLEPGTTFDFDAWDGYRANRNRVLSHLYDNSIDNVVVLSGDSHANWVFESSLPKALGKNSTDTRGQLVEFAGTAVSSPSPFGQTLPANMSAAISQYLVAANPDLLWSEGFYRGYFELHISAHNVTANYFAIPDILTRNSNEFQSGSFVVLEGTNQILRPASGGKVQAGALQAGGY